MHSTRCFITRWNNSNFVKNTPLRLVFSTLSPVFHLVMKHCVSCLIYYWESYFLFAVTACPEGDYSQKCCKLFGKSRPLGVEGNYIFQPFLRGGLLERPWDYYTAVVRFHRKPIGAQPSKATENLQIRGTLSSRPWDKGGGGLKKNFFGPSGLNLV